MHDPRVGRFFATDPLEKKYPWYTPYSFSGNKVIAFVELEGMEERWAIKDNAVVYDPGPKVGGYDSEASAYRALHAMRQKQYQHTTTISQDKRTPEQKERQRKEAKWQKVQDDSQKLIYSNPTNIIAHGVAVGVPELAMEVTGAKIVDFVGDTYRIFKLANKSSLIVRTMNKLDNGVELINITVNNVTANRLRVGNANGKVAVIGRGQTNRVDEFAKGINAETWKGFNPDLSDAENLAANKAWIQKLKDENYTVFDVGLDPKYTSKGDYYQSPQSTDFNKGDFYEMESKELFGDTPK